MAIEDTDSRYNHGYLRGALSIGVVGQTDGPRAGYGPGMTVLMTAPKGELGAFDGARANIADPARARGLMHLVPAAHRSRSIP